MSNDHPDYILLVNSIQQMNHPLQIDGVRSLLRAFEKKHAGSEKIKELWEFFEAKLEIVKPLN